jgi:homoserine dehydrogenase
VIQKGRKEGSSVPIVMMTHEAREAAVRSALSEIGELSIVSSPIAVIRVEKEKG